MDVSELDTLINKTALGLNIYHISKTAQAYKHITENNLLSTIVVDLHEVWTEKYNNSFIVNTMDTILFNLVGNPDILMPINEDLNKKAKEFTIAVENLYNVWKNYNEATILDSKVSTLLKNVNNDALQDELIFVLNKSRCFQTLIVLANKVINAFSNAKNEIIASKQYAELYFLYSYLNQSRDHAKQCAKAYPDKTLADDLIDRMIAEKKTSVLNAMHEAEKLELLLGITVTE